MGMGLFLTLLPLLGTPFSYWVDIRVYAKSCIFMVCSVEITGKPAFFLKRSGRGGSRKDGRWGEGEPKGGEGGETGVEI